MGISNETGTKDKRSQRARNARLTKLFERDPAEMFDEIRREMHEERKQMTPEQWLARIKREGDVFAKKHGLKTV